MSEKGYGNHILLVQEQNLGDVQHMATSVGIR